jgi:hypothetical protein
MALAGILAAALLCASLFGLWHVVVGGFVKGNWNAGRFGIALAGVAGVLLVIEASVACRLLPFAALHDADDVVRESLAPGAEDSGT